MPISSQQGLQRSQVVRQTADDLLFLESVGDGNLDGTIEG
jgi:hypothetical protein